MTFKLKTLLCRRTIALGAVLISSLFFPSLAAQADPLAYGATSSLQWGVVDLLTGDFTQTGTTSAPLSGLGEINGKLYAGGYHQSILYSVNPATGALTAIGNSSLSYFMTGSTTHGLFAFDTNINLFQINPSTGAAKLIGPTGLRVAASVLGASSGSNTLYVTVGSSLYSINTNTAASTLIGTSAGQYGPMVVLKGKQEGVQDAIFAGGAYPSAIWILNPKNGAGTFVADTTAVHDNFYGLAPDND
jgi:hypothetical protein